MFGRRGLIKRGGLIRSFLFASLFTLLGLIGGYILFSPAGNLSLKPEATQISGINDAAAKGGIGFTKDESNRDEFNRVIEGKTVFTLCGHSEPLNLGSFQWTSPDYLLENFPENQGWTVEDTGEKLMITKRINALCPADDSKRHLGRFGKYVAVIKGPVGIDGGILEVTDIALSSLPKHFREQAERGMLDFSDAQSLLEALDSMDEFQE